MKKLIFALLVFIGVFCVMPVVFAQVWHTANQSTVAWDAVSTNTSGDPIPLTDIVKYDVFIKNAVTGGEAVLLDETADLQYTITLNIEGSYFVGVKAKRYDAGNVFLSESTISWSDVPENCIDTQDFGIRYFLPPSAVGGLRHQ